MSALLVLWFAPVVIPAIAAILPTFDGRKRVTFTSGST